MGRLHILPHGYHWMEFGHEERDLKIIEGMITLLLTAGMLILAYYIF
ncbi:MAG: hypothetical protein HZA08_08785 [Nitrospirae bacterium]|nr:hypothetical protein [Nitrospirota bacterium]